MKSPLVSRRALAPVESPVDSSTPDPPATGREHYHNLFREAWTQKQDIVHEAFFDAWLKWSSPVVKLSGSEYPYRYPTSGASEGLREAIHMYGARARQENFWPTIHTFEGEYEGYAAYARAAGIPLKTHRRGHWLQAIQSVRPTDQFYISQPSGIDGNVWNEFDSFAQELARKVPQAQLMLDLSYVGCVAKDYLIDASYPNIAAIFLSLSKPAGVYYHRIGGMFSRHEYLGLFGNKWFKNISSLCIGTEFMSRYAVQELPRKYLPVQQQAVQDLKSQLGLELEPADIVLLAVGQPRPQLSDLERYLLRGPDGEALVRVCLTARMAHAIDPKLNPRVVARYYEQLTGH